MEAALVCLGILKEPPCPGLQERDVSCEARNLASEMGSELHVDGMYQTPYTLDKLFSPKVKVGTPDLSTPS